MADKKHEEDSTLSGNGVESAVETILGSVPNDKKESALRAIAIIRQESYSGPIPHPTLFEGYERILPGSADRILKMAEQQQSHRIEIENLAIKSQLKANRRGQIFGFLLMIVCLGLGGYLAFIGMAAASIVLIFVIIALVAALFFREKIAISADLKKKKGSLKS